jgi:hypothetical protein
MPIKILCQNKWVQATPHKERVTCPACRELLNLEPLDDADDLFYPLQVNHYCFGLRKYTMDFEQKRLLKKYRKEISPF